MLRRTGSDLHGHAERLAAQVRQTAAGADVGLAAGFSQMGSGSLPGQDLATTLVAVRPHKIGAEALAQRLRLHEPPEFARIQDDQVLIDPRTLREGDDEILVDAMTRALAGRG
jgi:L-seryl-tRNA(Ser) seleniumtransferase